MACCGSVSPVSSWMRAMAFAFATSFTSAQRLWKSGSSACTRRPCKCKLCDHYEDANQIGNNHGFSGSKPNCAGKHVRTPGILEVPR